jgi:hypothetical protein
MIEMKRGDTKIRFPIAKRILMIGIMKSSGSTSLFKDHDVSHAVRLGINLLLLDHQDTE